MKPLSAYRKVDAPDDDLLRDNALLVSGGIIRTGPGDQPSGLFDPPGANSPAAS